MGCVYQRGERWAIRFKDLNGKWVSRLCADTEGEAQDLLARTEAAVMAAIPVLPTDAPTLGSVWASWLSERNIRDNTRYTIWRGVSHSWSYQGGL